MMSGADPGFAPAKLNLTLHVTGQDARGWHLLDSLVVFADFGDRLRLGGARPLTITGPMAAGLPEGPDNLVRRAAALAGSEAPLTLEKHLPPASGMGGGSSDAAATLRLFGVRPETAALMAIGADLPVCMAAPAPTRMQGLGEITAPVSGVPGLWLLLANPGAELSTPEVFRALAQKSNPPMPGALPRWAGAVEFAEWLTAQRNDLEGPARALRPAISTLLEDIAATPGCLLARMTGSGATCFGIFSSRAARDNAAAALAQPGRWLQAAATAHQLPQ